MPEAVSDTNGALPEREAWRDVEGAEGPASAAVLSVLRWEMAVRDLRSIGAALAHIAVSPNEVGEGELDFLARALMEAAETVDEAFHEASDVLRPLSRAERMALDAEAERRRNDPTRMEAGAVAVTKAALAELRRCRALRGQQRAEAVA